MIIHRDVMLYGSLLEPGISVTHEVAAGRMGWLQVLDGRIVVNGQALDPGDGLAVDGGTRLEVTGREHAELLLFDMA